jgi:hypothetical protein
MSKTIHIAAQYTKTGARIFDGNPFIEALPPLESSKQDIVERMTYLPPEPTSADRKASEIVRIAELAMLNTIVYPLSEYKRAGTNATQNIRETYVGRNPITIQDTTRRRALSLRDRHATNLAFPSNFASTARGQALLGYSGCSKTTFANAFSLPYDVVIHHTRFNDLPFEHRQLPWVKLRVPHDATLKSLCLQFFTTVDRMLGDTRFLKEAQRADSIAAMALVMSDVCDRVAVGTIFIDEVQNLRSAKNGHAEIVLNFLSEIIESAGISLLIAGTPAVQQVIARSVRNIRKATSGGDNWFGLLNVADGEWEAFAECYWGYQFVQKKRALTKETLSAWYQCSAANPAFAALSFNLAQRLEIGGREFIDETSFQRVAKHDMSSLGPAVSALLSGKQEVLRNFDDLFFWTGSDALGELIYRIPSQEEWPQAEEFAEVVSKETEAEAQAQEEKNEMSARKDKNRGKAENKARSGGSKSGGTGSRKTRKASPSESLAPQEPLPTVDPFARSGPPSGT